MSDEQQNEARIQELLNLINDPMHAHLEAMKNIAVKGDYKPSEFYVAMNLALIQSIAAIFVTFNREYNNTAAQAKLTYLTATTLASKLIELAAAKNACDGTDGNDQAFANVESMLADILKNRDNKPKED